MTTMTATAVNRMLEPATAKQIDFLSNLIETKEISDTEKNAYKASLGTITKKSASILIAQLIKAPKKIKTPELPYGVPVNDELSLALASVPKSKYAIATDEIDPMFFDGRLHNDLIFFEVKTTYPNRLCMRKLSGSLGDFVRSKMTPRDQLAILSIIAKNPEKYARNFGEHFSCCGCCGAVLTDDMSRHLLLGPTCRTYFGYDNHGQRITAA